ncbi:hypothetical protein LTS10_009136 [Elasticomyces elasticus]|nr:hypothetical protein LTS10_009136 [Elasticomyces elasticus]
MPHNRALQAARSDCAFPRPLTKLAMASTAPKLLTMPPEMRNRIYELVFATQPEEADLLNPMPPTKQLLLACAQIYHEARGLYNTARRSYWRETRFTVCKPSEARVDCVVDLTEEQLSAVRHLQLTVTLSDYRYRFSSIADPLTLRVDHLDFPVSYTRCANGQWACTTASSLLSAGFRSPRVVMVSDRTIRLRMQYPSTPRCVIGREELEVMLECKLKLAEVADKQW